MTLNMLPSCPDWPLVRVIHHGHWTQPIAETFAAVRSSWAVEKHLHIYRPGLLPDGQPNWTKLEPFIKNTTLETYSVES